MAMQWNSSLTTLPHVGCKLRTLAAETSTRNGKYVAELCITNTADTFHFVHILRSKLNTITEDLSI